MNRRIVKHNEKRRNEMRSREEVNSQEGDAPNPGKGVRSVHRPAGMIQESQRLMNE